MSKREQFLLWMLSGLLGWQCLMFTYGTYLCSQVKGTDIKNVCPDLGQRYDSFVQTSLGAVLGLLAGSAISKPVRKRGESEPP